MGKSSSKKLKEPLNNNSKKIIDGLEILIITTLAVVIFYPPYLQGLFFEKHILPTGILVFSLFIIFCIYKWTKKDYTMFKTPINYISLAFVVVYFFSIFVAVHTRSAIIELLKYCMYFAVFNMITDIAESKKTKLIFLWTITASTVGVSIIGLDSAIGGYLVSALNKFFNSLGVQGDMFFGLFVYNRINSTLQYPNALASYVMGIFFLVIGLILSNDKMWVKTIGGVCAYILFLTFMLTKSRGAQLLFPVALIIFILASPKGYRVKVAVHVVLLAIPAIGVSFIISPYLSETAINNRASLLIVIGLITTAVLSLVLNAISALFQKTNWKIYIALVFILIALLPVGVIFALNSSIPLEISHDIGEPDGVKMVTRDIALTPGKDYIFTYTAKTYKQEDKLYLYNLRISSKSRKNILSYGDTELVAQNHMDDFGSEHIIQFTVPNDSKLISIRFLNYYSGTSVTIDNANIVDPLTGQVVKKIILKNKYNLDSVIDRFNNLRYDGSILSRIIFYVDGVRIFTNRWFLGGGGGAWEYLYRQYQSFDYSSTQAHNYPLQVGIETGILGLLALVLLIAVLLICYVRYYKKRSIKDVIVMNKKDYEKDVSSAFLYASIITAFVSLFLHSIIDFDFSEASMLLLFWQLLAVLNSEFEHSLTFKEMLPFFKKAVKEKKHTSIISNGKISIVVSTIIAIILIVFTINFVQASGYVKKAFDKLQENNVEEAINNMIEAIEKDKYNERYVIGYNPVVTRPDIKTGLADILLIKNNLIISREQNGEQITQTELTQLKRQFALLNNYMEQVEKKAVNNLHLTNNLATFNFSTGQTEKGITYLNNSIKLFPFNPSIWEAKVNVYYQLMAQYFNAKDYDSAKKYLDTGLNIIHEASIVNERNMNPFVFNEDTVGKLQMMQFINDFWDKEKELLKLNELVHYTIPYMDVNLDKVPDQWESGITEQVSLNTRDKNISIQVTGDSFIYTKNPLRLEMGRKYFFEVELDRDIDTLSYEILGIVGITPLQSIGQNKFTGELFVENEPSTFGHQFNLYFGSDCNVKSILVFSKE